MDPQVAERVVSAVLVFDELGARVEEVTFGPERNEVMFQDFFDYFAAKGYACLGEFLDDGESREQLTDYFRRLWSMAAACRRRTATARSTRSASIGPRRPGSSANTTSC